MKDKGLINIQGRLYPRTLEGIVSSAEHIFDPNINDFQTEINKSVTTLLDGTDENVQNQIDRLNTKLDVFMKGGRVSISVKPNIVYSYTGTTKFTITGSLLNSNPTDPNVILSILDNANKELSSVTGSSTISYEYDYDVLNRENVSFKIKATFEGIEGYELSNNTALCVEHPIYSGCSDREIEDVIEKNLYKDWIHDPTSSLPTKYTNTISEETNQYFYILVPSALGSYSSFTMGGSPFAMNASKQIIALTNTAKVQYNVYKSANLLGKGSAINVIANK